MASELPKKIDELAECYSICEPELTPEDECNLVGFFALLLKVDKRINPEFYKHKADTKI